MKKITTGFVIQTWEETGKYVGQEFVAGDECVYENDMGEVIELDEDPDYETYDMVQPDQVVIPRAELEVILRDLNSGCNTMRIIEDLMKYL
jgi:hypothetical protein